MPDPKHLMDFDQMVGPGKYSSSQGPYNERANYNNARHNTAKFASSAMPMDVTERGIEKQNERTMRPVINDQRKFIQQSAAQMMEDQQQFVGWLDKAFPQLGPASKQRLIGELAPHSAFGRARNEAEDVALEEQMHWLQLLKDTRNAQPKLKENVLRFQQAHDTPEFRQGEAQAKQVMSQAANQGREAEDLLLMMQSMESPTRVQGQAPSSNPTPQTPLIMSGGSSSNPNPTRSPVDLMNFATHGRK